MKTLARLLPLIAFVVILLVIRLAGISLGPLPAGDATSLTTATGATAASTTARPTSAAPSPEPTRKPTARPTPAGTGETTRPTTAATTAPTPVATADYANLDNSKLSWYYNPPSPLGQGLPATIPDAAARLAKTYGAIWQAPQNGRKVVYLTMDEGYEYETNTTEILNIAKRKGVSITFFITGSYLGKNAGLVDRMIEEGHLVANHTVNHPNLVDNMAAGPDALIDELDGLADDFEATTGVTLEKLVRPPEGAYSERVLACLKAAGYRAVFWSFAYRDWLTNDQPEPSAAKAKILGQLHDGSVILLHAVSNTNVAILPDLIDEIQAQGYEFALINEIG